MALGSMDGKQIDQTTEISIGIQNDINAMELKQTYIPDRSSKEIFDLVFETDLKKEEIDKLLPPNIKANFEELSDNGNMPDGFTRYRIRKTSIDGEELPEVDLMGTFVECTGGRIRFINNLHGSKLSDFVSTKNGENQTALVMPLPFENGTTEGLTMVNGKWKMKKLRKPS